MGFGRSEKRQESVFGVVLMPRPASARRDEGAARQAVTEEATPPDGMPRPKSRVCCEAASELPIGEDRGKQA